MTSRGRNTAAKKPVLHVEAAVCPSGGLHVLRWVRGVVRCAGCRETWGALDAAIREAS